MNLIFQHLFSLVKLQLVYIYFNANITLCVHFFSFKCIFLYFKIISLNSNTFFFSLDNIFKISSLVFCLKLLSTTVYLFLLNIFSMKMLSK